MADDFISLSNRLLNRCPAVGIVLAQQLVNDAWRTLQAREEWTFRRRSFNICPPTLVQTGSVSTHVAAGNPTLITGLNTNFTASMIGTQIRAGGLNYPYYTIVSVLSATSLLIDQPWGGPDVTNVQYQIMLVYVPMPVDFGYLYACVDIKNACKLWQYTTQEELSIWDPQRASFGQPVALVFRDYLGSFGGTVGPVIPVTSPTDPAPVSTTSTGFTYPANATYIIQVVGGGISGTATFKWMRAGQTAFQPTQATSDQAIFLADGVYIYWPDVVTYVANDLFVINCVASMTPGVPRYEMWYPPTFSGYIYPTIYVAKESDLTVQNPALPPFIANRGEVLLELALEKCATYPGPDSEHSNPYFDLRLARMHETKALDMLVDLSANDKNVGIYGLDYSTYPYSLGPWYDGAYEQRHAPFLT